ncbi:MAG: hypothetical protein KGI58_02120 [Patescibacteria group bacterium]|nr:hypothetical protein [Patescibacteria group bacterium]
MKNKKQKLNTFMFTFTLALIITLSFAQHDVFAQGGSAGGSGTTAAGSGSGSGDQIQDRDRIQDPTTHTGDEPIQDQTRDQDRIQDPTSSTTTAVPSQNQMQQQNRNIINVDLETPGTPAGSPQQLQNTIQNREQELNQEATNETQQYREVIQNQNRTRLAVQAIYSSEGLLGTVGPQAMQIANQINNTVQSTINAEAGIQSRGFWARLFFGGDKTNARIIQQEQEQNMLRIQELKKLINESTNAQVQATLMEQIRNMEAEQTRLMQLADKELGQWGIFSWRFRAQTT